MKYWIMTAISLALPISAEAGTLRFDSGVQQNQVIELFTSQGCNSCPPAEEFLNSLENDSRLWKQYFPIALHVDYWDYLGWKDRFARSENTRRQQRYARELRDRAVVTPAIFVNGMHWRGWRSGDVPHDNSRSSGRLVLDISGSSIRATFRSIDPPPPGLKLDVAIVGMGLTTRIRRGENAGRHSRHEFVLLEPVEMTATAPGQWKGEMPAGTSIAAPRYALLAWVSARGLLTPIQVTGGELPDGLLK